MAGYGETDEYGNPIHHTADEYGTPITHNPTGTAGGINTGDYGVGTDSYGAIGSTGQGSLGDEVEAPHHEKKGIMEKIKDKIRPGLGGGHVGGDTGTTGYGTTTETHNATDYGGVPGVGGGRTGTTDTGYGTTTGIHPTGGSTGYGNTDTGYGGAEQQYEKRGPLEKIKEKVHGVGGGHADNTDTGYGTTKDTTRSYDTGTTEYGGIEQPYPEKKGTMDKIKEKICIGGGHTSDESGYGTTTGHHSIGGTEQPHREEVHGTTTNTHTTGTGYGEQHHHEKGHGTPTNTGYGTPSTGYGEQSHHEKKHDSTIDTRYGSGTTGYGEQPHHEKGHGTTTDTVYGEQPQYEKRHDATIDTGYGSGTTGYGEQPYHEKKHSSTTDTGYGTEYGEKPHHETNTHATEAGYGTGISKYDGVERPQGTIEKISDVEGGHTDTGYGTDQPHHEKKGMMEKIKDKFSGH